MPDTDGSNAAHEAATSRERHFVLAPGSRLWLEGDSTLHRFTVEAGELSAEVVVRSDAEASAVEAFIHMGALRSGELVVPVRKLTSHESGLIDNLRAALKADRSPTISFRLESYEVVPASPGEAAFSLTLSGRLSIAGVERPQVVEAQVARTEAGLRLTGSKDLAMTDFGVRPPTLMMGMIRVKDRIAVRFDIRLQQS